MKRAVANQKLKEIIATMLGADEEIITDDSHLVNDLDADSLDIVEVIMAIEDHFEVDIPDEDMDKLETVGNVTDYIFNALK